MRESDLPPGCNVSDIPGNRPEDEAWDRFFETVTKDSEWCGLDAVDAMLAWQVGLASFRRMKDSKEPQCPK